jgi:hypothetical protein
LLCAIAVAVAIARPGRFLPGSGSEFALYGALHACALALSIGGSSARSLRRAALLIAGGAILAMATARLALYGLKATGAHMQAGPAIIAGAAALGAFAYGMLIRSVGAGPGPRSLLAISCACAVAVAVSLEVCRRLHSVNALWLVFPWWFAFSGGLCRAALVPPRPAAAAMPISGQSR